MKYNFIAITLSLSSKCTFLNVFVFKKKAVSPVNYVIHFYDVSKGASRTSPKVSRSSRFTSLLVKDGFKTRSFIFYCKSKNTDIIHQLTMTTLYLKLVQIQARSFGIWGKNIPISIHASCPLFGMLAAYLFVMQHRSLSLTLQPQMPNISVCPQL